jgi:hypothetical protein
MVAASDTSEILLFAQDDKTVLTVRFKFRICGRSNSLMRERILLVRELMRCDVVVDIGSAAAQTASVTATKAKAGTES